MIERRVLVTPPSRQGVPGFGRWVSESIRPGSAVLNIGAGRNLSAPLPRVRRRAGRLVGVDPDQRIHENPSLDESHQMTLEAYAEDHAGEFDVAFAVFVLEHVCDPEGFTGACARVLRPGGVLMAMTPNKRQYFGLLTWGATRLGLAEWLLPRLVDPREVADYHFPTEYRMNTIRRITRLLEEAGFSSVEFRMWDLPEMYAFYLPPRLRWFAQAWHDAAYRLGKPSLMGHITFKAVR